MTTNQTSISTYHEYILEAIYALRLGLYFHKTAQLIPIDTGSDQSIIIAEINCRYAFLMTINSIEAAANALLKSLITDKKYYSELERLSTLTKFKMVCDFNGKRLETGQHIFGNITELLDCRNQFVHPKPRQVGYSIDNDTSEVKYDIRLSGNRKYPDYFNEVKPHHALTAVQDTLAFISFVCFDICKFEIEEGALKLGLGSFGSTADIDIIGSEHKITFDKRSFGQI